MRGDRESLPYFIDKVSKKGKTLSCPSDCPVMVECAIDALENNDIEVIRAGVFLHPGPSKSKFKESRRRLEEIARSTAHKK